MISHNDQLSGLRILLVEDMALVADTINQMLQRAGCNTVGPFGTLKTALEAVDRENALCGALLDVNLNGEFVFPVADLLVKRHVPFIFLTGYGREMLLNARYEQSPMLEKPFSEEELHERMTREFLPACAH